MGHDEQPMHTTILIKKGREKKIRSRYPWVQRGEVAEVVGPDEPGLCRLCTHDGQFLAIGAYNPVSRFPVRVMRLEEGPVDQEWFAQMLHKAASARAHLAGPVDSWRLSSGEADGLPGLIIDWFAGHAVVQVRSKGMEILRSEWMGALEQLAPLSVRERSAMAGREEEGLGPKEGPLLGEPPARLWIKEHGLEYLALMEEGLKTGFYLDQRAARQNLRARVKPGESVLDCFCYSGGFSIAAAAAGAKTRGVDILPVALEAADEAAKRNRVPEIDFIEANAFEYLAEGAEGDGPFEWIILDPPAIAKTRDKKDSLKWAIWRLVHSALPILARGGRLLVCSCSYQLGLDEMLDTCRLAASDRGRALFLEEVTYQDVDHPAPLHFPEALYLKCAWLRAD